MMTQQTRLESIEAIVSSLATPSWTEVTTDVNKRSTREVTTVMYSAAKAKNSNNFLAPGVNSMDFAYCASLYGFGVPSSMSLGEFVEFSVPPPPFEIPIRDRLGDVLIAVAYALHSLDSEQFSVSDWLRECARHPESALRARCLSADLDPDTLWAP